MKLHLKSLLHQVTFSLFDSDVILSTHVWHPQSMSQARETAIIELKMVGAILRFISQGNQAGVWDICTPAFKYRRIHTGKLRDKKT